VLEQTFPTASSVDGLDSVNATTLVINGYANGSFGTVLFKVPGNTTRVVQPVIPGNGNIYPVSSIAAGGAFFVDYYNFTTTHTFWQKITVAGKVTTLSTPLGPTFSWIFLFGNLTALYVESGSLLLRMNPFTLAITQNLTGVLPAKIALEGVLPAPGRLYLEGTRLSSTGGYTAWFGFLTNSTGKLTTVSSTPKMPLGTSGSFYTMENQGPYLYLGGTLEGNNSSGFWTAQGYLYRYNTATGAYRNESSLLPAARAGVWAIEPWGKTIGISMSWFRVSYATGLSGPTGGIYRLVGTTFQNVTGFLPAGYVADIYDVTSVSATWFISGGGNTNTGVAQVVAIKT